MTLCRKTYFLIIFLLIFISKLIFSDGFVIFIDFITNLDPIYESLRVITCLHHPKVGLGEPSFLPTIKCESYVEKGVQRSAAMISSQQPVPCCPSKQDLTIIIEIQMMRKDEKNLQSCAWVKIPLFESDNLLCGRWRTHLKNLPIDYDAKFSSFYSLLDVFF